MIQNIRLLKAIVILLGIVIAVGLAVLLLAIGQRAGGFAEERPPAAALALDNIVLPPGAQVLEVDLDGNRVALRIATADGGEQLLIFDLASGARLGAVSLSP